MIGVSGEERRWTDIRIDWIHAAQAEQLEREAWASLPGWQTIGTYCPVQGTVLVRDPGELPHKAYWHHRGWWAIVCGDIWPMQAPPAYWQPIPQ